ncbi:hypothetical protein D3C76_975960 [compost metagenome]
MVDRQLGQRLGEVGKGGRERIGAAVGQLAGEDFVEHHAEGIEVGAAVDLLAARLLRAHVAGRADGETGLGELGAILQGLGDAEVREHRRAIGAEQDVGRFHIPVDQALGMGIAERRSDLAQPEDALLRRHALGDALFERAVGQVLHGHVVVAADMADVMDGDRVRMAEPRQGLALAQKAFAEAPVGGQGRGHDLQRHLALQRALGRQIDGGHRALAELSLDLVPGNLHVHARCFHHQALTTTAVMLSGAPRVRPRWTRLRTIS